MRLTVGCVVVLAGYVSLAGAQPDPETDSDDPPAAPAEGEAEAEGEGESKAEPEPATTGLIEGTVEAPDLEAPLSGVTVTIVGTEISATTDDEGRYQLRALPGNVKLRAEVVGFKISERTVTVTAGKTSRLDFQLDTEPLLTETIVVVGSRTPRTNVETPVPVDVVTAEELGRSGRNETGRVLHTLAASYVSTPQSIADGSDHVDPASLRGLGPDQVLILVNGKRRHRSALLHVNGTFGRGTVGTDLNAIPVSSIKRIEILRDGAAAQYGSDAIAGVINIVTKDSTDLLEVNAMTGITASRDGAQLKTGANYGFKVGERGFVNVTGEYLEKQATNRAGVYTGTVYSEDRTIDDQMLAANGLTREDFAMKIGESAAIAGMGAYNLELPISGGATFYSFGDISHRRGAASGFYRFPKDEESNVPQPGFYPHGFLPAIHPVIDDHAISIGIRRKGDWTVDASLTHGKSAFKFNVENSVNASLGTESPTTFDAGTLSFEQTTANLDLIRPFEVEDIKSIALVLGSELRVERYQIEAGDEASYEFGDETYGNPPKRKLPGAQVFPGFTPDNEVDRTRDSIGVYSGVETELTKRVSLDLAGRFESYSDFGRSLIGKIAGRAKLADAIALRGAASTGFRAPSLHQLWFSNVSTLFVPVGTDMQPAQVLTSNNKSPVTKAFGIPKLEEERSFAFSGGVALRPSDALSVTVDGYYIHIDDRIVLTSQFLSSNPIVEDILVPFPGVSRAQFFANAVDTNTKGIDVVADYTLDAGDGTLTLTASANYSFTKVVDVNLPQSLVDRFGANNPELRAFFFGRLAENRLESAVPRQKGTAAIRYALKGLSALARANYYGPVYYRADDVANDEEFGAKVLFDVDLGYQVTKEVALSIGGDNIFNTFPDRQTQEANISSGRFIYSRNVSQFGQNGAFYYAKLGLTFF